MVRNDYECSKCDHGFIAWSDDAKFCPHCGSKRIKKVFLTPPAASTGRAAKIEKLAEKQLDAAGLSNYTNVGGTPRRTRRTHPTEIAAQAAAKSANIPIQTGPATGGIEAKVQQMREQYRSMGAQGLIKQFGGQGKTTLTSSPRGPGQLVNQIVQRGRQLAPLASMGQRIYSPTAKEDSAKLKQIMGK